MRITDVLRGKGDFVVTIAPDQPVTALLDALAEHRVGALVVSPDGTEVVGIVSERDVVRGMQAKGASLLDQTVKSIMTAEVHTCAPDTTVADLMMLMTERRIRHVPVVSEGRLTGIISIGDVVKSRIGELEFEREQLDNYIQS
jgi:CBS domain-containing protein